jgi:hypothetical protein
MRHFEFVSVAKPVRDGKPGKGEVGVWVDGVGLFSDNDQFCAFMLVPGREYRITVEEVKG